MDASTSRQLAHQFISYACEGQLNELNVLLENDRTLINTKDPFGNTALHWAIRNSSQTPSDLSGLAQDKEALQRYERSLSMVQLLLNLDADTTIVNKEGETALTMACHYQQTAVIRLLLAHGANANALDQQGNTPLTKTCALIRTDVLRILLDSGVAQIDLIDGHGETPLMRAARLGRATAVTLLLHRGADPRIKNPMGQTAADLAKTQKLKSILEDSIKQFHKQSSDDGRSTSGGAGASPSSQPSPLTASSRSRSSVFKDQLQHSPVASSSSNSTQNVLSIAVPPATTVAPSPSNPAGPGYSQGSAASSTAVAPNPTVPTPTSSSQPLDSTMKITEVLKSGSNHSSEASVVPVIVSPPATAVANSPTSEPSSEGLVEPPKSPQELIIEQIRDIYRTYAPEKLASVGAIIAAYRGREGSLLESLKHKYVARPSSSSPASITRAERKSWLAKEAVKAEVTSPPSKPEVSQQQSQVVERVTAPGVSARTEALEQDESGGGLIPTASLASSTNVSGAKSEHAATVVTSIESPVLPEGGTSPSIASSVVGAEKEERETASSESASDATETTGSTATVEVAKNAESVLEPPETFSSPQSEETLIQQEIEQPTETNGSEASTAGEAVSVTAVVEESLKTEVPPQESTPDSVTPELSENVNELKSGGENFDETLTRPATAAPSDDVDKGEVLVNSTESSGKIAEILEVQGEGRNEELAREIIGEVVDDSVDQVLNPIAKEIPSIADEPESDKDFPTYNSISADATAENSTAYYEVVTESVTDSKAVTEADLYETKEVVPEPDPVVTGSAGGVEEKEGAGEGKPSEGGTEPTDKQEERENIEATQEDGMGVVSEVEAPVKIEIIDQKGQTFEEESDNAPEAKTEITDRQQSTTSTGETITMETEVVATSRSSAPVLAPSTPPPNRYLDAAEDMAEKSEIQAAPAESEAAASASMWSNRLSMALFEIAELAIEGRLAAMITLLSTIHGVLEYANEDGNTLLMTAAKANSVQTVGAILQNGVDVNTQNSDGETALMIAVAGGHKLVVQALLAISETNTSLLNKDGLTAIELTEDMSMKSLILNFDYCKIFADANLKTTANIEHRDHHNGPHDNSDLRQAPLHAGGDVIIIDLIGLAKENDWSNLRDRCHWLTMIRRSPIINPLSQITAKLFMLLALSYLEITNQNLEQTVDQQQQQLHVIKTILQVVNASATYYCIHDNPIFIGIRNYIIVSVIMSTAASVVGDEEADLMANYVREYLEVAPVHLPSEWRDMISSFDVPQLVNNEIEELDNEGAISAVVADLAEGEPNQISPVDPVVAVDAETSSSHSPPPPPTPPDTFESSLVECEDRTSQMGAELEMDTTPARNQKRPDSPDSSEFSTPPHLPASPEHQSSLDLAAYVTPQFSTILPPRPKIFDEGKPEAMERLMQLPGLQAVKRKFIEEHMYHKIALNKKGVTYATSQVVSCNARFDGNVGTMKYEVVQLYKDFLMQLGQLPPGSVLKDVKGSDLIGGGMALLESLLEDIREAGGGIIFIDSIFQIYLDTLLKDEIINTIVTFGERFRGKYGALVWVIGDDTESLNKLFDDNTHLTSRFPLVFKFEDFNDDELFTIFKNYLNTGITEANKSFMLTDMFFPRISPVEGPLSVCDEKWVKLALNRISRLRGTRRSKNMVAVESLFYNSVRRMYKRASTQLLSENNDENAIANLNLQELTREDLLGPKIKWSLLKLCQSWQTLQEIDGLQQPKNKITDILQMYMQNAIKEEAEEPLEPVSLNFLFLGNGGTGKRTVAFAFAQILYDLSILPTDKVVVVSAYDLIRNGMGSAEAQTRKVFASADGGLLIIDDAHNLFPGYDTVGSSQNDLHESTHSHTNNTSTDYETFENIYKRTVINTIIDELNMSSLDTRAVILIGYQDYITQLLDHPKYPLLRKCFPTTQIVNFPDLPMDHLKRVLLSDVESHNLQISMETAQFAIEQLKYPASQPNFTNIYAVRHLLAQAILSLNHRLGTNISSRTLLGSHSTGASPGRLKSNIVGTDSPQSQKKGVSETLVTEDFKNWVYAPPDIDPEVESALRTRPTPGSAVGRYAIFNSRSGEPAGIASVISQAKMEMAEVSIHSSVRSSLLPMTPFLSTKRLQMVSSPLRSPDGDEQNHHSHGSSLPSRRGVETDTNEGNDGEESTTLKSKVLKDIFLTPIVTTFDRHLHEVVDHLGLNSSQGVSHLSQTVPNDALFKHILQELHSRMPNTSSDNILEQIISWQLAIKHVEKQVQYQNDLYTNAKREKSKQEVSVNIWKCAVCGSGESAYIRCFIKPFVCRQELCSL